MLEDEGLNEFGFVALLHASHTVSVLSVPAVSTPSPDSHVLWVLQPSPLVVEEKVLPVHARHAPELNPCPGGHRAGAGHVDASASSNSSVEHAAVPANGLMFSRWQQWQLPQPPPFFQPYSIPLPRSSRKQTFIFPVGDHNACARSSACHV
jgi:hypothetical protein